MAPLTLRPLTAKNWREFEILFGERGACGGCWCQWWRLSRADFDRLKGDGNKKRMRSLVHAGEVPGLLGYREGAPVAWCSLAPRESFPVLDRSRVLKRVDDKPVWSLVCFFVAKPFRRQGLMPRLIAEAAAYARQQGVEILEAYPVEPKKGNQADLFLYTGVASAFRKAGFAEVARRSPTRPIMRLEL